QLEPFGEAGVGRLLCEPGHEPGRVRRGRGREIPAPHRMPPEAILMRVGVEPAVGEQLRRACLVHCQFREVRETDEPADLLDRRDHTLAETAEDVGADRSSDAGLEWGWAEGEEVALGT